MGKALSTARRAIRNFDIEDRAHRFIEKNKNVPKAAPKHYGSAKAQIDTITETMLGYNKQLNENVDLMVIKSKVVKEGILPEDVDYVKQSSRKLPQKLYMFDPFPPVNTDFGFAVPEFIPKGKLTMRQAADLVKAHQTKQSTIEQLSLDFSVAQEDVENIVEYFSLFSTPVKNVWLPPTLLGVPDQPLLEDPLEELVDENLLGGSIYNKRSEALQGLNSK